MAGKRLGLTVFLFCMVSGPLTAQTPPATTPAEKPNLTLTLAEGSASNISCKADMTPLACKGVRLIVHNNGDRSFQFVSDCGPSIDMEFLSPQNEWQRLSTTLLPCTVNLVQWFTIPPHESYAFSSARLEYFADQNGLQNLRGVRSLNIRARVDLEGCFVAGPAQVEQPPPTLENPRIVVQPVELTGTSNCAKDSPQRSLSAHLTSNILVIQEK